MTAAQQPRPVVIDTDPGLDDALALLLALRAPEWQVELITTVAGNVPVAQATANVHQVLAMLALPTAPVVAVGSRQPLRRPLHTATMVHGDDGLGGITTLRTPEGVLAYPPPPLPAVSPQAVPRLLRVVRQHGRALTVIALGPLTNIARAIQADPETMRQLGSLVIMGGAIAVPGNVSPVAEFNIYVDPHAADIVFQAGLPITLIPLDVTQHVRLTPDLLPSTRQAARTPVAQALFDLTRYTFQRYPEGMTLHDPLAVAVALDPSLVTCVSLSVGVETRGTRTRGMTVADRRPARTDSETLPRLEVAMAVQTARVLALCMTRWLA